MDKFNLGDNDPLEMRPETRDAFRNILDCFSGADGGISFWRLRMFLEEMDKRAKNKDEAAQKLIDIVLRMSRIIDAANKYA